MFEDHGRVARTIDEDVDDAATTLERLQLIGIDMDDVGLTLEEKGVASFHDSFAHVLQTVEANAGLLARP